MKAKQIVAVSGLSGAGKSTVARALEDIGFFVADNLPPALLDKWIALCENTTSEHHRFACVIDAREQAFLSGFPEVWQKLKREGIDATLVFLEASDEVLVTRFKETRRPHPLDESLGLKGTITLERKLLEPVRALADQIWNTDEYTVHQLRDLAKEKLGDRQQSQLQITLLSFGFKHGVPAELDLCFDVRFLKNPFFVPELKQLTGLDRSVVEYVFNELLAKQTLKHFLDLLHFLLPQYEAEGKSYLTVALGCTGGRHRSPALVEALAERLRGMGCGVRVEHRDVDHEY